MTDADTTTGWTDAMVSVLRRRAAPSDEQERYLRDLGVAPSIDELGLEFDDCFRPLAPRLADDKATRALEALIVVDAALSDEDLPWTDAGLRESPEWEHVRALAREAERLLTDATG